MKLIEISEKLTIGFETDSHPTIQIYDNKTNKVIGSIEFNDDYLVVGANIETEYQKKGIATHVVRSLVKDYGMNIYFWKPDGIAYDDGRHLSEEGANLACSLIEKGLAKWKNEDWEYYDDDDETF